MKFMTLTPHPTEGGENALSGRVRKDLGLIDAALASREKRALAEVALRIAARMIERTHECAGEAPL